MSESKTKGLFIFRRDLRAVDNIGLDWACSNCNDVYCLFILDERQIYPANNKYYNHGSFLFMLDSLVDLKKNIHLKIIHGLPHKIIKTYIKQKNITHLIYNRDYTPFSIKRDSLMVKEAKKLDCKVMAMDDICINPPDSIKPYKIFSPYYKVASQNKVSKNKKKTTYKNIKKLDGKTVNLQDLTNKTIKKIEKSSYDINQIQRGGRNLGLYQLKNVDFKNYEKNREILSADTSRLSPHLKFGTLSVREVYYKTKNEMFQRQLYWRDFYLQKIYHFPSIKDDKKWVKDAKKLQAWKDGKTGFKIVDAAMNQLNTIGYMHNRARMVVASFLTKLLNIDWREGAKYFAQKLVDYDWSNNDGNWMWIASVGPGSQNPTHIFNPMTQLDKYDKDDEYIETWLPENYKDNKIIDYKKAREKYLRNL